MTIIKSTNEFATAPTPLTLPNDEDSGIDADDFTRGQSFYDLMIESDPNNPETIYAGGIDLFKSTTGAENATANPWEQFTHWYNGFGQQFAHADQHNMAFGNYDSSKKYMEMTVEFILVKLMVLQKKYPLEILIM